MNIANQMIATSSRLSGVREYYFSRKLKEIAERRATGETIINLGIGNPDLPPPPAVTAALLGDLTQDGAHGYQSYQGTPRWRRALRNWYKDTYKIDLLDNEVLPLAGSKEGIVHLTLAFIEKGEALLHPDPGYPAYKAAAELAGGEALPYRMPIAGESPKSWLEELSKNLAYHKVKLMFVNSPHMPTGQIIDHTYLEILVAFAKTNNILLVSDNAYSYYNPSGPQSLLSIAGAKEVVVELNSLSKSHHMPGWRLGVLVGRSDVLASALQVKSNLDSGQFRPLQAAASVALKVGLSWHQKQLREIKERRAIVSSMLAQLGCEIQADQHGLFVWAKIPGLKTTSEAWCNALLDSTGVFFPPGTVFGPAGEGYVRASLCSPKPVLAQAAKRITAQQIKL